MNAISIKLLSAGLLILLSLGTIIPTTTTAQVNLAFEKTLNIAEKALDNVKKAMDIAKRKGVEIPENLLSIYLNSAELINKAKTETNISVAISLLIQAMRNLKTVMINIQVLVEKAEGAAVGLEVEEEAIINGLNKAEEKRKKIHETIEDLNQRRENIAGKIEELTGEIADIRNLKNIAKSLVQEITIWYNAEEDTANSLISSEQDYIVCFEHIGDIRGEFREIFEEFVRKGPTANITVYIELVGDYVKKILNTAEAHNITIPAETMSKLEEVLNLLSEAEEDRVRAYMLLMDAMNELTQVIREFYDFLLEKRYEIRNRIEMELNRSASYVEGRLNQLGDHIASLRDLNITIPAETLTIYHEVNKTFTLTLALENKSLALENTLNLLVNITKALNKSIEHLTEVCIAHEGEIEVLVERSLSETINATRSVELDLELLINRLIELNITLPTEIEQDVNIAIELKEAAIEEKNETKVLMALETLKQIADDIRNYLKERAEERFDEIISAIEEAKGRVRAKVKELFEREIAIPPNITARINAAEEALDDAIATRNLTLALAVLDMFNEIHVELLRSVREHSLKAVGLKVAIERAHERIRWLMDIVKRANLSDEKMPILIEANNTLSHAEELLEGGYINESAISLGKAYQLMSNVTRQLHEQARLHAAKRLSNFIVKMKELMDKVDELITRAQEAGRNVTQATILVDRARILIEEAMELPFKQAILKIKEARDSLFIAIELIRA
ncbi:hypothetical protein DRN86_00305 [Candidatus Geothermarchaeota archaeon]|nr:MAG: hypothetical protein DRN86_00305 [Candidatus Geothermarchaeota archaeon]